MKKKWKGRPVNEKVAFVLNGSLFLGMIFTTIIYYSRKWILGKDLCWFFFILHYFVNAAAYWKTNHEEAQKALFLGCFLSLMHVPVWLLMLLTF